MNLRNTRSTYGSVAKFFHWFIFILVFSMIIYGYFLDDISKAYQPFAYNLHKLIGLSILVLMIARALWAMGNLKPELPFDTLPWQKMAEHTIHFLLYAVIIAMPLAGFIGSLAAGRPPHLGSFKFEFPFPQSKALSEAAFTLHGWLAILIIVLVSIHVLAALYHHFIKRDNILRRMMPHQ